MWKPEDLMLITHLDSAKRGQCTRNSGQIHNRYPWMDIHFIPSTIEIRYKRKIGNRDFPKAGTAAYYLSEGY